MDLILDSMLTIDVFPRVHITLISLAHEGYRMNGGIGFSLDNPSITIEFTNYKNIKLVDLREATNPSELAPIQDDLNSLMKQMELSHGFEAKIIGNCFSHVGLGTGTMIRLACIEALFLINGIPYNSEKLVSASRRGGTSGIGIRTYFKGGYVFDLGHSNDKMFVPSNQAQHLMRQSLLLHAGPMPQWEWGLALKTNVFGASGIEESAFFKNHLPLPIAETWETLYHSILGVHAAYLEGDRINFGKAIRAIQTTSWKSLERDRYGKQLTELETAIYSCGAEAVGMSSMGPCLFFLSDDIPSVINKLKSHSLGEITYLKTSSKNTGRVVRWKK